MAVAYPISGTIVEERARCACGEEIKLVGFNWLHTLSKIHTCKKRGNGGSVQQES